VLKVRIVDKMEERVELVMQRESVFEQAASAMKGLTKQGLTLPGSHRGISKERALHILEEIDEARKQWGLYLYGIDTTDSSIYDLVIHINKLSADDAAEVICFTAGLSPFQATAQSQQVLDDLLLAARVKASLIERHSRVNVTANEGSVYVGLEGASSSQEQEIRDIVGQIRGVKKIDVYSHPFVTPD
jgi:hypothetical protein